MKALLLVGTAVAALMGNAAAAQELKFPPGQDARFNWKSYDEFKAAHADIKGQPLTLFGPWRGDDEVLFNSVLAYFNAATGADGRYSSSENYEQQIVIDTQAGSPPNIAIIPQPGLLSDLAAKGYLTPLGKQNSDWIKENYGAGDSWVGYGTYKGKDAKEDFYAFPYKADLKSLIWYVPENFEEAGYDVPKTMEDLFKLSDQIVKDGGVPWCIGLGSGGATGWPATDWIEDLMLRMNTAETYDGWVSNGVKFDDPKVVSVIEEFGKFAKNDKYVSGGVAAVASTDFRDSPKGLFGIPPKCYLHHQASFIPTFFPTGTKLGTDADFFYMPTYAAKPELGTPVLGAGTLVAVTKDSPAAQAFIEFLKTPIAHEIWMAQSGFLTPFKSVNVEAYGNDALRKQGEILSSATTFRFDGSDLMPGKIGAGAFWTGMVNFVGGKDAKTVGTEIQKAWDGLK
jgi:alpha-glucoside transport system substrate-binding protein